LNIILARFGHLWGVKFLSSGICLPLLDKYTGTGDIIQALSRLFEVINNNIIIISVCFLDGRKEQTDKDYDPNKRKFSHSQTRNNG
jgi:hypothetical protein